MQPEDIRELSEKHLCAGCIGEAYLRECVENVNDEYECDYCGDIAPAISLEELASRVEIAFNAHFTRTATEPNSWQYSMLKDKELDYDWEREGEQTIYAIMNAADIPEATASDVQEILADEHSDFDAAAMGEECEFDSDAHYEEIMPGDGEWQESWHLFERTIKTEARFFSRTAAAQLGELFDTIDEMRTRDGRPLIVDAGPDTKYLHLYRARPFQNDGKLELAMIRPDKELGAPPSHIANSGRMNARGIAVFYGATSVKTALAEVRPPVGSKVAVARFDIIRPLKLLDLTALGDVHENGSIFDPGYAYRLGRMMFLQKLSSRMARPVMPDDQESEYLPTQAIADYLATEGKVPLDGIVFPSVQVNGAGLNVVLFHKAARCKEMEFPEGTEFDAQTYTSYEDGPEPDYVVIEEIPPEREKAEDNKPHRFFEFAAMPWPDLNNCDDREETLSVDPGSLKVHRVNAIEIDTTDFQVRRHRWIKNHAPF
ncbi:RES family NAD+ phosphorylase [Rhizobium lentis]|uniref:RES family NAD+ phosphorylase n=1 Tax=Rhizobium lentis TaxID=1138194 RepID=A0A9Q3M699_9HYPH|nr:RES family NAD+ phosphorylase [Rhizobium lentis]MBX5009585.1 RES family NAD+ phosphorylase [Rhizobium lentis]MBX5021991.1 RES family NAD+ phosphorylase [Rhizobium lentis]